MNLPDVAAIVCLIGLFGLAASAAVPPRPACPPLSIAANEDEPAQVSPVESPGPPTESFGDSGRSRQPRQQCPPGRVCPRVFRPFAR